MQDALKSPDPLMKMGAIRVIQETPKEEYVSDLINAMEDRDRLVRISAAIALGKIKSEKAVIPLIRHAVTDHDKEVQSYALWAFRQIDYQKTSPQLVDLLTENDNRPMIHFAANEIRQKNDVKAIEGIIRRFESRQMYAGYDLDVRAAGALYEIGNITVEPLVKCLDSDDLRVQVNAIYTLGKIGDPRAVLPLISHIASANMEVRSRISDALIKIGNPAIPDLVRLLEHNDKDIKWIASYTLGKMGEDAEKALLKMLSSRGEKSPEDLIYALGIAGSASAFSPVYKIYENTKDDGVKAWTIIALCSIVARNYEAIADRKDLDSFIQTLGDQLKPHMLLEGDTLLNLGKIYVARSLNVPSADKFSESLNVAVKCFDLSIIERESTLAKAYRLFYGSYLKLMSSRSPEIMSYIEKDFIDLKKEAERSENKKEIMLITSEILAALRNAYNDRSYNFAAGFASFVELCSSIERFMPMDTVPKEESRKLSQKEMAKLHADTDIIQRKITTLIEKLNATGNTEAIAQTMRLSAELTKFDTGMLSDYRVMESCLKNIVSYMKFPAEEKSALYFKILMVTKNGLPQIESVIDQVLKGLETTQALTTTKTDVMAKKEEPKATGKKSKTLEYVILLVLIILIIIALLVGLNKYGYITLPFRFPGPLNFLNRETAALFLSSFK